MNSARKCAKCTKTVYPTEELRCLDKFWHKACFKCTECSMTLNMKNYKGYNKMPYCNAHYPTTKHTVVADTPENRRIAENTKIQSAVKYHEDFEKQKGHKTSVVDDPETARIKQNTNLQSNVAYWGIREQRSAQESKRPNEQVEDAVPEPARMPPPQQKSAPPPQVRYQAIYDYTAADDDEVSFQEGDYITNCEIIDEGWMTGTVMRTGQTGMLPSNYVERC